MLVADVKVSESENRAIKVLLSATTLIIQLSPCGHTHQHYICIAPETGQLSFAATEVGLYGRLNFLFGQVYGCGTSIIVDSS